MQPAWIGRGFILGPNENIHDAIYFALTCTLVPPTSTGSTDRYTRSANQHTSSTNRYTGSTNCYTGPANQHTSSPDEYTRSADQNLDPHACYADQNA